MTGLVSELQELAIQPDLSVSDLLKMVKLAAVKLKLGPPLEWVERELTGYSDAADIPDYRIVRGSLFAHTLYQGKLPIAGDPATIASLSTIPLFEPLGTLESLLNSSSGHELVTKLDQETTNRINEDNGGLNSPIYVHISPSQLVTVVNRVRYMVLNWAVELEERGVMGEGISFSTTKKGITAAVGQTITIGTLHGALNNAAITGDNNTTALNADNSSDSSNQIFNDLSSAITSSVTNTPDREAMLVLVDQLKQQQGHESYKLPFASLMEYAANYITVLGPFIPALTTMFPG